MFLISIIKIPSDDWQMRSNDGQINVR